jgi:hypothetical protein
MLSVFLCSLSRADAQKMEEWARSQNGNSLVEFSSRDGEIEGILKDISERAKGTVNFSYSRFFAVGLFRLLELSNATEPTVLDKVGLSIIKLSLSSCVFHVFAIFFQIIFCIHPVFLQKDFHFSITFFSLRTRNLSWICWG